MPTDDEPKREPVVVENPHTSIAWSIISVFLFWPLGIISFIYYFKSDQAWSMGNQSVAERNGRDSIRFAKYSVWALVICIVLGVSFPFFLISLL